jgi:hypothetical protein
MQFSKSGLECSYIQNLLKETYIPTVRFFNDTGDYNQVVPDLVPGEVFIRANHIYKFEPDQVNGYPLTVIGEYEFGKNYPCITTNYISKTNYYDSDLHEAFGRYVRFYNEYHRLGIMGLYNCFSNRYINDFYLPVISHEGDIDGTPVCKGSPVNTTRKIIAVPIKYNKSYEVALTSLDICDIQCAYYDGKRLISVYDNNNQLVLPSCMIYTTQQKVLQSGVTHQTALNFNNPITIISPINHSAHLRHFEKYLYLFIGVSNNQSGQISVIESDSTIIDYNKSNNTFKYLDEDLGRISRKTLLKDTPDKLPQPYSDKLLSFVIGRTISQADDNNYNVLRVQQKLSSHKIERGLRNTIIEHFDSNEKQRKVKKRGDAFLYLQKGSIVRITRPDGMSDNDFKNVSLWLNGSATYLDYQESSWYDFKNNSEVFEGESTTIGVSEKSGIEFYIPQTGEYKVCLYTGSMSSDLPNGVNLSCVVIEQSIYYPTMPATYSIQCLDDCDTTVVEIHELRDGEEITPVPTITLTKQQVADLGILNSNNYVIIRDVYFDDSHPYEIHISKVPQGVSTLLKDYTLGTFDNNMRKYIQKSFQFNDIEDFTGYVDRDIESIISGYGE